MQLVDQRGRVEFDHQGLALPWIREGEGHAVACLAPQRHARGLPVVRQENHHVIIRGSAEPRSGLTGHWRRLAPRRHDLDLKAGAFEQGRSGMTGNLPHLGEDLGLIHISPGRGRVAIVNHERAEDPQVLAEILLQAFLQVSVLPSNDQDRRQQNTGKQEAEEDLPRRKAARTMPQGGHRHEDESRQGRVQDIVQGLLDRDQQGLLPDHPHDQMIKQQDQGNADQNPIEGDGEPQSGKLAATSPRMIPMPAHERGLGETNHEREGMIPEHIGIGTGGGGDDQARPGAEPSDGQEYGHRPEDEL